ncbi:UNVERIFIED_CONTAM: hypothetical protein Slati_1497400 [Sesamum latifolium]|uniref:Uncharacterized protein n=1 Tax=Sesamum latifolium TaxID=2727402 RepID=A0AAW2X5P3_9LAMI
MMEYSFPAGDGTISSIALPIVQANNFEIKPSIIQTIRSMMMLLDLEFSHFHYVILLKIGFNLYLLLDRESLYDAWEHFKGMLRICPHHELPVWWQVQTFYNGITLANRATIDAAGGGTIMKKLPSEGFNIIDEIATNLYSYGLERTDKRVADVHNIDAITTLSAQMTALMHKVSNLGAIIWNSAPIGLCSACGHKTARATRLQPQQQAPQEKKNNLEDMLFNFITAANTKFQNQDASIWNLEVQIGQLEVISNKRKWEGGETVKLNEECSAILQNKVPPKLKDPKVFLSLVP